MRRILYLMTLTALLVCPSSVWAAAFSFGAWQADGHQMWRTSFPLALNTADPTRGASELYYPEKGTYVTGTYENNLPKGRSLRLEAGVLAHMQSSIGSDTDWKNVNSPDKWYYGEFTDGGSGLFVNADQTRRENDHLQSFIGYGYRNNRFSMNNGVYNIVDSTPQSPPVLVPALASSYTTTYQGPHVGWTYTAAPHEKLTPILSLTYTPFAFVQGQGWWNLRNLAFTHYGPGQMLDTSISLRYLPDSSTALTVGYRYQRNSLYRGWENTDSEISWDQATNVQQGAFFTASGHF